MRYIAFGNALIRLSNIGVTTHLFALLRLLKKRNYVFCFKIALIDKFR